MKSLHLQNKSKSDIDYDLIEFPDGQNNIVIKETIINSEIIIKSRLNNFQDLEIIIASTSALRNLGVKQIYLYTPYILGGRSDRQFVMGGNHYLKQVICPIINSLDLASVIIMDSHSDVLEACLNNFEGVTNNLFVKWAIKDILELNNSKIKVVVPDGGALKKIYITLKDAEYEDEILIAHKHREVSSGKLMGFEVPIIAADINKALLWVDDIGDGCGTFIGEAIEANKNGHKGKKYLILTHGIFSKGFKELAEYFDGVYCTNSYSDLASYDWKGQGGEQKLVKQFNVF